MTTPKTIAEAYADAARLCRETAAEALEESGEMSRILDMWFRAQAQAIEARAAEVAAAPAMGGDHADMCEYYSEIARRLKATPLYYGYGEESDLPEEAADAIEAQSAALTAATDRAELAEARAERLRVALVEHNDLLRSAFQIADREGVKQMVASTNWDAFYNRVTVVLKRYHETTNKARAAIAADTPTKEADHE